MKALRFGLIKSDVFGKVTGVYRCSGHKLVSGLARKSWSEPGVTAS